MPEGPIESSVGCVLVVGAFPPVPGPTTAATVALVRAAVAAGHRVRTASVRPGGAELVVRATGPLAGVRLNRVRRATGAGRLVVAVDDGVPALRPRTGGGVRRIVDLAAAHVASRSLAWALRRAPDATVLVATDPGLPTSVLSPLWRGAATVVVAGPSALARSLGIPAGALRHEDPPVLLGGLVAAGVTARGPAEVTPLAMPRYMAGVLGRRVLGARFMPVYTRVMRARQRALAVARPVLALRRSPAR
jgi:hypothetical protein